MTRAMLVVLLTAGWMVAVSKLPGGALPTDDKPVAVLKDVYPFLKRHCVSCHNDVNPRAERSLTGYQDAESIHKHRAVWDDVLRHVEAKSMPPAAERQPTAGEVEAFLRNVRRLREQAKRK